MSDLCTLKGLRTMHTLQQVLLQSMMAKLHKSIRAVVCLCTNVEVKGARVVFSCPNDATLQALLCLRLLLAEAVDPFGIVELEFSAPDRAQAIVLPVELILLCYPGVLVGGPQSSVNQ
jgi:hypothetical protein